MTDDEKMRSIRLRWLTHVMRKLSSTLCDYSDGLRYRAKEAGDELWSDWVKPDLFDSDYMFSDLPCVLAYAGFRHLGNIACDKDGFMHFAYQLDAYIMCEIGKLK